MSFSHNPEHIEKLHKSYEIVGALQKAIIEKDASRVLVGRHRKFAVPSWPEKRIHVKSPLHRELIIVHGQVQRGLGDEEAKVRVNRIAEIVASPSNQDIKYLKDIVTKPELDKLRKGIPQHEVCFFIIQNKLLPWTEQYVRRLIHSRFKDPHQSNRAKHQAKQVSPRPIQTANIEAGKVRSALKDLQSEAPREEIELPYPDCLCKKCPHRNECY